MDNGKVIQVGNIVDDTSIGFKNPQRGRIYSTEGLAPCLNCCGRGGLEPKIVVYETKIHNGLSRNRNKQGKVVKRCLNGHISYLHTQVGSARETIMETRIISNPHGYNKGGEKDIAPACTSSKYQDNNFVLVPKVIQKFGDRGTDQYSVRDIAHTIPANPMSDRGQMLLEPSENWQTVVGNKQLNPFRGSVEGTSPCITSACGAGGVMTPMLTDADLETTKTKEFIEQVRGHEEMRYRIRKLTPRECFRLMGVDDNDIDKIQAAGISNSQQYKLAGNSIVVDVLYHIFRKVFCETHNENQQQTLF